MGANPQEEVFYVTAIPLGTTSAVPVTNRKLGNVQQREENILWGLLQTKNINKL